MQHCILKLENIQHTYILTARPLNCCWRLYFFDNCVCTFLYVPASLHWIWQAMAHSLHLIILRVVPRNSNLEDLHGP